MATEHPSKLTLLSTITPSSSGRAWQSRPHPTLPLLATACADKTVRLSSLRSFTHQTAIGGGHKRSIRSVAWKPSSGAKNGESVLATGSFDASAGIWRRWEGQSGALRETDMSGDKDEEEEWQFAVVLDGHDSEIKGVAYSSVGPFLATCSRDKSVWVWEELEDDNYETVAVLQEHEGDVKCVAWHPTEVMLASGSYDDTVRLWREEGDGEDWGCAAVLQGFGGTVWGVDWEGAVKGEDDGAGPRLATCSDDLSVRIWRRVPKERKEGAAAAPTGQGRMPSILRTHSIEEEWVEQARLPQVHTRSVYAVSWSRASGRIVSCGGDGRIVVYEERPGGEWVAAAEYQDAHDVFEVNHVCWAPRADKGKQEEGEEVVVSTGDDGEVKVWSVSR